MKLLQRIDLKEIIGTVITQKEYSDIKERQMCMGNLRNLIKRIADYLYEGCGTPSGGVLTWDYTETRINKSEMGTISCTLWHDDVALEVFKF